MPGTTEGNKGKTKNKALKSAAKKTQYGQPKGNKPSASRDYSPMDMRAALRHFATQLIDLENPKKSFDELKKHHKFTIAEGIALKRLEKALDGDSHAADRTEDALCGKLADTHIIRDADADDDYMPAKTMEEAMKRWEDEKQKNKK